MPAIKTSKEFKKESDFKCGNGMLVVAVLMLLLPEPVAAADGGSEASGSPVCAALLLMFLIVVGSLQCVCAGEVRRGPSWFTRERRRMSRLSVWR